jgi:hypothetical protein
MVPGIRSGRFLLPAAAAVAVLILVVHAFSGNSGAGEDSHHRWFVCAETQRPFRARVEIGTSIPVMSPFSHRATGYPAELCYWTKEGTITREPTPVLLRRFLDPADNSPTFCPDCGRLVVAHNPPPIQGQVPPTQEEWLRNHGGTAGRPEESGRMGG